jgi:hypothetical protein
MSVTNRYAAPSCTQENIQVHWVVNSQRDVPGAIGMSRLISPQPPKGGVNKNRDASAPITE